MPGRVPSKTTLRIRASAWARVLSHFGTPERPRSYAEPLWLGSEPYWARLEILAPQRWDLLVLCTKQGTVEWWRREGPHPRDVAVVYAAFPNDPRVAAVLAPLHRQASATLFVGDMDPNSIVQYVETRRALGKSKGRPVLYGGVDDAWLVAMERALRPRPSMGPGGVARVGIPLSREERRLLREIEDALDLEGLLGPRSCAMLRGGHKVELEGATNPAIYRPSRQRWALRHLRALGGRADAPPISDRPSLSSRRLRRDVRR